MSEQEVLSDYDSEPVVYCAKCLSLKVRYEDAIDGDCCMDCGCTDTCETSVENWEQLYERKYGHKYTEKNKDIRKSPVFKMSLSKLMHKVSDSSKCDKIIKEIYPHFPKGLSHSDSVVLFFDLLIRHNKLDALRTLLYNWKV